MPPGPDGRKWAGGRQRVVPDDGSSSALRADLPVLIWHPDAEPKELREPNMVNVGLVLRWPITSAGGRSRIFAAA
jgi:hypothetical protein